VSLTVAAWGGGVNSTAMVVEWLRREQPLDYVLFADTGGEKPTTYAYLETFALWLQERKVPFVRLKATVQDESLKQECLRSKRLPSLAYGFKKCSLKWKRQPQDKWLNNSDEARAVWAAGGQVLKLIGYDAGEKRRAVPKNGKSSFDCDKYTYRYPLIEWDWDRDACVDGLKAAGLPIPPKSSCFFCPASTVKEILDLQEKHPDLLERALAMENNAENTSVLGLGRRFNWGNLIKQDRAQLKLWDAGNQTPCDCWDGEEE